MTLRFALCTGLLLGLAACASTPGAPPDYPAITVSPLDDIRTYGARADYVVKAPMAAVEKVLLDFERRGHAFFDERLRLMRIHELLSKERLRKDFETTVVADLPREVLARLRGEPS